VGSFCTSLVERGRGQKKKEKVVAGGGSRWGKKKGLRGVGIREKHWADQDVWRS